MTITLEQFISQLDESGVISAVDIAAFQESQSPPAESAEDLGKLLVKQKKVTKLQAQLVYQGKGDRLLLGNYLILDKIGAGGMGDVYLAEHRRMERRVALKTLPATMTRDTQSIQRFHREVKAAAKLSHPNIVAAYDADEANGVHYFVMEHVDGTDLSAVVKKQGVLKVETAIDYILQAAKGLEFAHNKGVIHRDIKPANMLLDNDGTVKILDMGLARIEDEAHEIPATQLTQDGSVMGTVDYMAPEQAKDTHTADARSDIYSLGCSLYYLLTGESVYRGSTMVNRIMAHQNDPIPSLAGKHILISQDVDAVFQKMVAKKPEDRFQSMSEVIVAIENCIQMKSSSTVATEPSDPELQKFLQSQKFASSPTVVMSADAMAAEKPLTDTQNESLTSGFLNNTLGGTSYQPLAKRKQSIGKRGGIIAGVVLASLILIAGIVFKIDTPAGTIILDIDQPELAGAVVSVDDQQKITIKTGKGTEPIEVVADEKTHTLQVTKGGFETFTKQFTVNAGGKETIEVRLEPVEVATKKKPSAGTPAKSNSALRFQNRSDHVALPLKHETAGDLTVEAWVTIDENSNRPSTYITNVKEGHGLFLSLASFWGDTQQWGSTILNNGEFRLVPSHSKVEIGKRTNIAVIYKGNVAQIYVNGHKKGKMNFKELDILTDRPFSIGWVSNQNFKGSIDEVRFSNTARYSEDFTPTDHFENDKNTLALYHFDEGSGDILKDSSGNGHDGKIVGAKWVKVDDELQGSMVPLAVAEKKMPSAGTPAKSHSALRFQNDSDRVILPLKHETAGDLTVEAWVTIDENSNRPLRIIANGSSLTSFGIGYSKAEGKEKEWSTSVSNNGQFQVLQTDSKVEFGKRTNIAVTYKGNVAQIYVNGHKKGEMNFNGSNIHTDEFITIGNRYKGPPIKGSIDEVRFSNIARYTEDFTPTDHFQTDKNTLALYHFDEGSGDILKDASGNGHDGKIVGAKWVEVEDELQVVKPATTGDTPMTDREVAEWVIGMGGWVNTGGKNITKIEQLPTEPFIINFLDLKGTSVKDEDLKRLAGLKTLPKLNLENTLISDTGLQYLKDIPLNYISLIGTQITDKGFGYLSNMPSLTTLYVGSTAISNSGVEQLKDMKQLEKLSFTNTQIDGVGLGHLKDLKNLKILGLESTSITDVDLQHLHGLKILIVLGLSNCKIADSGLAYLKDLKNLKVLSLDSTPITDVGLKHLSGLKMLQTLELQKTKVTPQGIADLQKALPNCKILSDFETKPPPSEKTNYALEFDGKSNHVKLTGIKSEGGKPFTIEGIVVPKTVPQNGPKKCFYQIHGMGKAEIDTFTNRRLSFMSSHEQGGKPFKAICYSKNTVVPDIPMHVACVYDGNSLLFFVNGIKQNNSVKIQDNTDKTIFEEYRGKVHTVSSLFEEGYIGSLDTNANDPLFFHGIIDEVRISNVARYDQDFTPARRFENDDQTLALYHFDEAKGDVLKDSSGNGHHGKIVGAKWVKVDDELQVAQPAKTGEKPMTDREIAEWVIGMGGVISVNGKTFYSKIEELPTEPVKFIIVYLKTASFEDHDLQRLAKLKTLVFLNLDSASISDAGLQYLKEMQNLNSVYLNQTKITDEGLVHLRGLQKLGVLSLQRTKITGEGLGDLKDLPSLKTIDVNGAAITNSGMQAIGDLKQLTSLNIAFNSQIDDTGLEYIEGLTELKELFAHLVSKITDEGLKHLQGMKQLETLTLASTGITNTGLEQLAKHESLNKLDLTNCKITDSGLTHLKNLKNLRDLRLDLTPISDAGLQHLYALKKLEYLNLRNTKVTAQGIAELQKALPNCKIVSDFETKPIMTSDSPMTDREIAEWVIGMGGAIGTTAETLYSKIEELPAEPVKFFVVKLKTASFEDNDLKRLVKLKTLGSLKLDSASISNAGLQYLSDIQNLITLNLLNTKITDEGLVHLRNRKKLQYLVLSYTSITGEGLSHLKDLPGLMNLMMDHTAITNSGMKAIGDLKHLNVLNIAFNPLIDDSGLRYLEGLVKLERLYAHDIPQITDEGLKYLQGMKQLDTLTLSNTGITNAGLEQLAKHESLSELGITNCKITDSGLTHLKDLKNLRDLRLDLTPISDAGLQHLYGLKKLEYLNLRNTKVTAQGIAELQKALPNCKIVSDFEP